MEIFKNINANIQQLESVFTDCGDIVSRKFSVGRSNSVWAYVIYIDSLIDRTMLEYNVINKLMLAVDEVPQDAELKQCDLYEALKDGGITAAELSDAQNFDDVYSAILSGDTALFIDGCDKALVIGSKGWSSRGVQAAETEATVLGPKEAFSEGLRLNTMLIRRRIRDVRLKVKQSKVGSRSQTSIALMYIDGIVRPDILREAENRLNSIDIDAIFDSGYIDQLIEDDWLSPFPQTQSTERPDKAASAIMEGRIVIIVDTSPFVLIIPSTLNTYFQSPEDYYQRFQIMSFVRILRYIAGFLAVTLPGLYIAITIFHPSMIPMLLILKMSGARQNVPFPAIIEILIMELAFELLREAGIRLPGAMGGAIGIVGGLIVGQAAVEAGIVSPIVVVVIALTGICSFTIPHVSLVSGFRLMKFFITIFSSLLGFLGFWTALLLIFIHLSSLKSFSIPYLFPYVSGDVNSFTDMKDSIYRAPIFRMKRRPIFANRAQTNRKGDA